MIKNSKTPGHGVVCLVCVDDNTSASCFKELHRGSFKVQREHQVKDKSEIDKQLYDRIDMLTVYKLTTKHVDKIMYVICIFE